MSKDGSETSSTLAERLAAKLEADRKQIEELTLSEHRKLAQSFLDASTAELRTIRSAIHAESEGTVQTLREMLRLPLWTAAGCMMVVIASLAFLWAGTWWMRSDLEDLRRAVTSERQALSDLTRQTHGIRFRSTTCGTFLVLPSSADVTTIYGCEDQKCLKLGD